MKNLEDLRNFVLWFGDDVELAAKIADYLHNNNEKIYNYLQATENQQTSREWCFWEYEIYEQRWVRSRDKSTLERLPMKDIFSRKAKLERLNNIAKRRRNAKK